MGYFSFLRRKKPVFLLQGRLGHPENVKRHDAAGDNVVIQVTYDGHSWSKYREKPRALLFFTIQFSQPHRAILKDTQIALSFDCHPTEEACHALAGQGCRNVQKKRDRGVVDVSIPSTICGERVGRDITRHFEYQGAPSFEIASLGAVTLGHIRGENGFTQRLERVWDFTSRVAPPRKFDTFPQHTDVSYEWKRNEYDIASYPNRINFAVIVNCGEAHALPLTLCIDGSLGGTFTFFSKLKYHETSIAINRELGDLDALNQQIERLERQTDTV